jgi:hypothetical protein
LLAITFINDWKRRRSLVAAWIGESMKERKNASLLLAAAIGSMLLSSFSTVSAQTVERSLSISPFGMWVQDNAQLVRGFRAGVLMGDPAGSSDNRSSFYFGFTVPEGFTPGSTPVVRVVWSTTGESCDFDLRNNALSRHSVNGAASEAGSLFATSGLPLVSSPISERNNTANYTLFGLGAIAPGDAITASLFRSEGNDTCPNVIIHGVSFVYESQGPFIFRDAFEG